MGGKPRRPRVGHDNPPAVVSLVTHPWPLYGLNHQRLCREQLEALFAELWAKENGREKRAPLLAHLLSDGRNNSMPPIPSDRDWLVANTIVQWLGSPVGQAFLEEVKDGWEA
jgi:hypothetical protein